jgi:hypothetical protein
MADTELKTTAATVQMREPHPFARCYRPFASRPMFSNPMFSNRMHRGIDADRRLALLALGPLTPLRHAYPGQRSIAPRHSPSASE